MAGDDVAAAPQRAANLGHVALYACMVVAPLAGYLGSNFSKYGVRFFGVVLAPWGPDWPAAYSFLVGLHDASTYLLLALTVGHVAMALQACADRARRHLRAHRSLARPRAIARLRT